MPEHDCKCDFSTATIDCRCIITINKKLSLQLSDGKHKICKICGKEIFNAGELMRHERDAALFLLHNHKILEKEYGNSYLQNLSAVCKFARKAIGLTKEELSKLGEVPISIIDLTETDECIISNQYLFMLEALLYRVQMYGDASITNFWKPISHIKLKLAN